MCDYSLHSVATRPAKVGDRLISTRFPGTFTRGFTAVDEPTVAVCLRPGTELAFEREIEVESGFRRLLPRFGFGKTGATLARFRQINLAWPDAHHDALEIPDGKAVLVTNLCEGQVAAVLQLPASAMPADYEHAEERAPAVARTPLTA